MAFFNDSFGNRVLDILTVPAVIDRCTRLNQYFEQCSLRELQDVFPKIVQSIFGFDGNVLGWGLRTYTKENAMSYFDVIHSFFAPMGPMLQVCYRLLSDGIKFEFNLERLPHKVSEMIQSGQYSIFYADLVNVDPFRRQVTSLSLNAFDYYILHFVIHATFPLHKMFPTALQVHNETLQTIYFYLVGDYLVAFLPMSPDEYVLPNISHIVKAVQPMPVQSLQPKRLPKYLKIPNAGLYANSNATHLLGAGGPTVRNSDAPRALAWRSESVLNWFIDIWLRHDVAEARDLPSGEFIRVIRLLVKHVFGFADSAYREEATMLPLRKIALPMLRARIYPFLKSIIARWPLDGSLSVVLELWLSYIQPWRYTCDSINERNQIMEIPISNRYDCFIIDNLVVYTQIFLHILPRFERLDYTSPRNTTMLYRLVKVFCQSTLPKKLYQAEQSSSYLSNASLSFGSPQKHSSCIRNSSTMSSCDWDSALHEEVYTSLFSTSVQAEIEQFLKSVYIQRMCVQKEINTLRIELEERMKTLGFLRRMHNFFSGDISPQQKKLNEISRIPASLDYAIQKLAITFNVTLPRVVEQIVMTPDIKLTTTQFSPVENAQQTDLSHLTPSNMKKNRVTIKSDDTIDPTAIRIQSHELELLVVFFHYISCWINERFGDKMQLLWNRNDFCGKLTRQILMPPMTAQWFDKPRGITELCEADLPAKISLRPLASYFNIAVTLFVFFLSKYFIGSGCLGLLILILTYFLYLCLVSFFS